jgi:hypothetical protein
MCEEKDKNRRLFHLFQHLSFVKLLNFISLCVKKFILYAKEEGELQFSLRRLFFSRKMKKSKILFQDILQTKKDKT